MKQYSKAYAEYAIFIGHKRFTELPEGVIIAKTIPISNVVTGQVSFLSLPCPLLNYNLVFYLKIKLCHV